MKKILFLLAVLPVFLVSCSDDSKEQTVLIDVFYRFESHTDREIATPTVVKLYDYEEAKNFDKKNSVSSMANSLNIVMPDGSVPRPRYTSNSISGINTIQGVKNGKYLAIVFFKPDGFTFDIFFYYGYKVINVNKDTSTKLYDLVFTWDTKYSGKFYSFD